MCSLGSYIKLYANVGVVVCCDDVLFFSRALQSKENSLGLDADHSSLSLNSMSVQLQSCKVNEWTGKGWGGEGRTEEKKSRTGIPS